VGAQFGHLHRQKRSRFLTGKMNFLIFFVAKRKYFAKFYGKSFSQPGKITILIKKEFKSAHV